MQILIKRRLEWLSAAKEADFRAKDTTGDERGTT